MKQDGAQAAETELRLRGPKKNLISEVLFNVT